MAYEEKYQPPELPHNLILENRSKLSLSGIRDVESFDEGEIIVATAQGTLIIQGQDLHIEKLSLDSGDVVMQGLVYELKYEDDVKTSGGFISRLFR